MPLSDYERGFASRHLAWQILMEQEKSGTFLKGLFAARLQGETPDKDLVRTLCLGVIRWRRLLDYNLDMQATRSIPDRKMRMLLRLGAFQLFFLNGVPAYAAVDTTVELVKAEFGKFGAGFANALLKALSLSGLRRLPDSDPKAMAVNHSHPDWLVEHWSRSLSKEALERALSRDNEEAPLWIRVNPRKGEVRETLEALRAEDVSTGPCPEADLFHRILSGADKALRSPAFAEGRFSFQDPVAYFIACLLDWHPGLSVLDACAAPGGKSALLLELCFSRGEDISRSRILCADLSGKRLRKIRDARERLGHSELMPVVMDLEKPACKTKFDRVLLDAPCSNLGVLRRRPEARWNQSPENVSGLAKKQLALLESASHLLAPSGILVYAVCSPEPEETMEVVEKFLTLHPGFKLADISGQIPEALQKRGCLWIYPGETEFDGFFAAVLKR